MTEDEVEVVAAELAKAGGVSWYPGRERGPVKIVSDRYRDRARLAIGALERYRASKLSATPPGDAAGTRTDPGAHANPRAEPRSHHVLSVGGTILYRPPGDQRAYPCRVEKIDGGRAYLVPDIKTCTGWVDLERLLSSVTYGPRDTSQEA